MTGNTPIRGNLRLVLDEERRRVDIHYTAMNQVIRERQPSVIVSERLDLGGQAQSKRLSRQVSL